MQRKTLIDYGIPCYLWRYIPSPALDLVVR